MTKESVNVHGRTKRSTQAADSITTYINIKRGGWVTANVRQSAMNSPGMTKDQLIGVIFELLDDNDAVTWENDTVYTYLQRLAEYLDDTDIPSPTWQAIADALVAAKDRKR